jgi:hypothetical protein
MIQTVGMNYIAIPEAIAAGVPVWNHGTNVKAKRMMTAICTELKTRIDK